MFPSIKLMLKHEKAPTPKEKAELSIGELLHLKIYGHNSEHPVPMVPENLEPFTGVIRPKKVPSGVPEEMGMLASFLASAGLYYSRVGNDHSLKRVIRQDSGKMHPLTGSRDLSLIDQRLTVEDHAHWYLKTCVKTIRNRLKGTDRQVILLGRDVWLVSVLCQKLGVSHVYDPRVSRGVATSVQMLDLLPCYALREGDLLFDTGFAGSIHRAVTDHSGIHLENLMMSANDKGKQLFPNSGIARNYALFFEYLPKYFKTGTVKDGKVVQYYAEMDEFLNAAVQTIWAWHYESPNTIVSNIPYTPRALRGSYSTYSWY